MTSDKDDGKFNRRQVLAGTTGAAAALSAPWIRKARAAELEKVRMAVWGPRLAEEGNVYVSEKKGYFKDERIELEWVTSNGSGDALKNVIAGNADIGFVGPESIILAADKGARLKIIYDLYPQNFFNVFALKEKQILTPNDLRGKKVGVISMAAGVRYNLATVLFVNGMRERDVEPIAVGLNATPAILDGRVDAMASTDVILYGMQRKGLGCADVIWANDYLNISGDVLAIRERDFSKRDLWLRFLRAYRKGVEFMIKDPDETAAITAEYALDGKDPIMVSASIKLRTISSQSAGTRKNGLGWIDTGPLQDAARIYKAAGFISKDIDMSSYVSNELVQGL
jgi:NitT/TauT family transport system substrate-binding protein